MTRITIYTDGACSGNPGPAGWAAILVAESDSGEKLKSREVWGNAELMTNNRAEMSAVILGLRQLTQPSKVTIVSDSQYIVRTMNEGWRRRENTDLWTIIDNLSETHEVTWQWVRGHNNHTYNDLADKLAVYARSQIQELSHD